MSIYPSEKSNDELVREIVKPFEELLAKADEKLKQTDQLISEAERKGKLILDPESRNGTSASARRVLPDRTVFQEAPDVICFTHALSRPARRHGLDRFPPAHGPDRPAAQ
jgi:hypothetical protein